MKGRTMKASTVIEKLTKLVDEYGDLDVDATEIDGDVLFVIDDIEHTPITNESTGTSRSIFILELK
jgi:hypothetical protein